MRAVTGKSVKERRKAAARRLGALPTAVARAAGRDPVRAAAPVGADAFEGKAPADTRRDSDAMFVHAFQHAMTGMAIVDVTGRPLRANRALCDILGYSEDELCRGTVLDVTHGDDIAASTALIGRMLAGETPSSRIDVRIRDPDRSRCPLPGGPHRILRRG